MFSPIPNYNVLSRGKYQGFIGVIVAFGYAIGPIVGGVLSENVSWRVCLIQALQCDYSSQLVVLLDYCADFISFNDHCVVRITSESSERKYQSVSTFFLPLIFRLS